MLCFPFPVLLQTCVLLAYLLAGSQIMTLKNQYFVIFFFRNVFFHGRKTKGSEIEFKSLAFTSIGFVQNNFQFSHFKTQTARTVITTMVS